MGWMLSALRLAGTATTITLVSSAHDLPPPPRRPKPSPRINGSPRRRQQPSVAEVQRAIGIGEDPRGGNPSSSSTNSPLMDLVSSTPIGQPEGPAERKIRQAAEWMVDRTEGHARAGQQILLVVCLWILPVWFLFLLVASGLIKLPVDLPFIDDLIS